MSPPVFLPLAISLDFTEFWSLEILDLRCVSNDSTLLPEDSASIRRFFVEESSCLSTWFSFTSSTFFLYSFFKMSSSIFDWGTPSGPFPSDPRPAGKAHLSVFVSPSSLERHSVAFTPRREVRDDESFARQGGEVCDS